MNGAEQWGGTIAFMESSGLLTYGDLAQFPEDGLRRKLFEGALVVSPSPRLRHQRICMRLGLTFGNHIAAHGGGDGFAVPRGRRALRGQRARAGSRLRGPRAGSRF